MSPLEPQQADLFAEGCVVAVGRVLSNADSFRPSLTQAKKRGHKMSIWMLILTIGGQK
jgi:hypothetical protein